MDLSSLQNIPPNTKEYAFSSATHGIENLSGHKTTLTRCKRTDITSSNLSDHHGVKLDINNNQAIQSIVTHGSSMSESL